MNNNQFDAIVVGSGISGGWAAKELTEKGLRTLVIERGEEIIHGRGYKNDFTNPWDKPARGFVSEERLTNNYYVQKKAPVFNALTIDRFVDDQEHPYIQESPFDWIRGYHTGGKSLLWGRQCYRLSDLDFTANKRDGHGVDWPIRYSDLASWYDYVEEFSGISGNADEIDHLPGGKYQPPMEMNLPELALKQRVEEHYPNRHVIIGRTAHLTQPTQQQMALGRGKCQFRNQCARGCSFGGYFSSLSATLPAAKQTRKLTLKHNTVVKEVIYDPTTKRATGVRVIDSKTLVQTEIYARVIFLCASTVATNQILLNSKSAAFPTGIANSSGVLGKYIMDHIFMAGATGKVAGFEDSYEKGRRPNGLYIPRFRNIAKPEDSYTRGFGYQAKASRASWQNRLNQPEIGQQLKDILHAPAPWEYALYGFGEMLPRADNTVTLSQKQTDKWGIPLVKLNVTWGQNEYNMREDMVADAVDMLTTAGATDIKPIKIDHAPGFAIHEMGGARMGRDAKTSVLNQFNQCHDVPNLFVTDGAAMSSSACQNPSLTYMALTARAADYATREIANGRI